MTTPDLSAEMIGWLRAVLFLLTAMVVALCGIAVVAIASLCVQTFRQVSTAGPPPRAR